MRESAKIYKEEIIAKTKEGKYIKALVCQNDNGEDRKNKKERYKRF